MIKNILRDISDAIIGPKLDLPSLAHDAIIMCYSKHGLYSKDKKDEWGNPEFIEPFFWTSHILREAQILVTAGHYPEEYMDRLVPYLQKHKLTDPVGLVNLGLRGERLKYLKDKAD